MTNYNHLLQEQRDNIQYLIELNKSFTYIASSIKSDRTTISKEIKRKLALLKGRTYEDYLDFILKHPNMNVCERDTVEGKQGGKVFLTIIIRNTKFMFIRLLDKKTLNQLIKK